MRTGHGTRTAALLGLALVAAAACRGASPVATMSAGAPLASSTASATVATATAAATEMETATGTTTPAGARALRWRTMALPDARSARVADVAYGAGGFVAVGNEEFRVGKVWISRDGLAWERVPLDDVFDDVQLRDVAATPGGYVAVGHITGEPPRAAAWSSVDGRSWVRITSGDLSDAAARGAWLETVASGPRGLAVMGRHSSEAAAWASPDSRRWTRVPVPGAQNVGIADVAATESGFVAVGRGPYRGSVELGAAAAWVSADGTTWSRAPDSEATDRAEMGKVVSGRGVTVAAGHTQVEATGVFLATLWHSSDGGTTWARAEGVATSDVPPPAPGAENDLRGSYVRGLAVVEGGAFVAVGGDFGLTRVQGEQRAIVWTSQDGRSWTRQGHEPVFELGVSGGLDRGMFAATAGSGVVVVVGARAESDEPIATVWIGEP